jgi:hypothetical protein
MAQVGLELPILLPQPSEGWDYRYVSPGLFLISIYEITQIVLNMG